ncbi:MAG: hypothetical protein ABIJ21_03550 [Nanoarchaeota archaeon]
MKIPLAIIVGKSIEDIVSETRQEETVQERMLTSQGRYHTDDDFKEGYETLPCKLDYQREYNEGIIRVRVYSYANEPPQRIVKSESESTEDNSMNWQTQVVIRKEGILVRSIDSIGGARVIYAQSNLSECRSSALTSSLIEAMLRDPRACNIPPSQFGKNHWNRRDRIGDVYNIRILIPIQECEDLTDDELICKYGDRDRYPSRADVEANLSQYKSLITLIRESLERLHYELGSEV